MALKGRVLHPAPAPVDMVGVIREIVEDLKNGTASLETAGSFYEADEDEAGDEAVSAALDHLEAVAHWVTLGLKRRAKFQREMRNGGPSR